MTMRSVDPYSLSNDRNGFSAYACVLFANEGQQRKVQAIRDAVRNRRSMMPAHVTAKGPVCGIPDIETVQTLIGAVVSMTAPFTVTFEGQPAAGKLENGEIIATQPVAGTLELVALHRRLLEVLAPMTTNAYPADATGQYHPHLAIYHEPGPDLATHGEKLLATLEMGTGFEATALHLMGHVGRPYQGRWEFIQVFPFGC